jgi:hypothetical protein
LFFLVVQDIAIDDAHAYKHAKSRDNTETNHIAITTNTTTTTTTTTTTMPMAPRRPSSFQLMFYINAFSVVYALVAALLGNQATPAITFLARYPTSAMYLLLFSVASAAGQVCCSMIDARHPFDPTH